MTRSKAGMGAAAMLAALVLSPATVSQVVQPRPDDARLAPFDAATPESTRVIDYAVIDRVLQVFVIDEGNTTAVRYGALKGDGGRVMKQLFAGFENIDIARLNAAEQLAYWLNLRMLLVMHVTGEAFPDARPEKLLSPNGAAFTKPQVTVAGVKLSIADVDRIILAKGRSNPHVVYGLVVPAREAPAFPKVAFRSATVHAALEASGRRFINRRGVIRVSKDVTTIPRFLADHRVRLGQDDTALLGHIRALAATKTAQQLAGSSQLSENRRLTLNNFAERNLADFVRPAFPNSESHGGVGS